MRVTFTQRTMKWSEKVVHPPCFLKSLFKSSRHCHLHTSNPSCYEIVVDNKMGDILFSLGAFCVIHPGGSQQLLQVHQKCHCPSCVCRIITSLNDCTLRIICSHPIHSHSKLWNSVGIVPLSRSNRPPRWPSGDSPSGQIKIAAFCIQQSVMDEWRLNVLTSHSFRRNSHQN